MEFLKRNWLPLAASGMCLFPYAVTLFVAPHWAQHIALGLGAFVSGGWLVGNLIAGGIE